MITSDGWLDWAEHMPGPIEKQYTQPNALAGFVAHSAVGYLNGWLQRLFSMERVPGDPSRFSTYAAASMHLWIGQDGRVLQHYGFLASCWAHGNRDANLTMVGAEFEGGAVAVDVDEPLRDVQVAAAARILRELGAWRAWPDLRRQAQLFEHRELAATLCPSGRIPWDRLIGEALEPMQPLNAYQVARACTVAATAYWSDQEAGLRSLHPFDKWVMQELARRMG